MIWPFHSWVRVRPPNASKVPSGCAYTEQCKYCGLIRHAIRRKYPKLTCQPINGYGTEVSHYSSYYIADRGPPPEIGSFEFDSPRFRLCER